MANLDIAQGGRPNPERTPHSASVPGLARLAALAGPFSDRPDEGEGVFGFGPTGVIRVGVNLADYTIG